MAKHVRTVVSWCALLSHTLSASAEEPGFLVQEVYDSKDCSGEPRLVVGLEVSDIGGVGSPTCFQVQSSPEVRFSMVMDNAYCVIEMRSAAVTDCAGDLLDVLEEFGDCEDSGEDQSSKIVGCSSERPSPLSVASLPSSGPAGFLWREEYSTTDCTGDPLRTHGFQVSDIPHWTGSAECAVMPGSDHFWTFHINDEHCMAAMRTARNCSGDAEMAISILDFMADCEDEGEGSARIVGCSSIRPAGDQGNELAVIQPECIDDETWVAINVAVWPSCTSTCEPTIDCTTAITAAAVGGCASSCAGQDALSLRANLLALGIIDCSCPFNLDATAPTSGPPAPTSGPPAESTTSASVGDEQTEVVGDYQDVVQILMELTVEDPLAFVNHIESQNAVEQGIAAVAGVDATTVDVALSVARRLSAHFRKLQSAVNVNATVVAADSVEAVALASEVSAMSPEVMTVALNDALQAADVDVVVAVLAVEATASNLTPSSSDLVRGVTNTTSSSTRYANAKFWLSMALSLSVNYCC